MKQYDPILRDLNEPQREAVLHRDGPILILAGAGSGKTRALTHRIAYLMEQGIAPWQILAVTFTNKAANAMIERIRNLLHILGTVELPFGLRTRDFGGGRLPVMGTFHNICVRILRRDIEHLGRNRSFVIYDSDDQERLMKRVLKAMHVDEKELKARTALGTISRFKAEALGVKEAAAQATTARMHRVIQAYEQYQRALREANALDFDDLILETVRLFIEIPEILERYQKTWRYLHVDEYQDTNHAQYLLISLLARRERNLCVIGDPDQSIYGFRGADLRNILEFKQEYPDAVQIKLEQNYRSTRPILDAANAVIAANPRRPEKSMWTERKEGPSITAKEVADERAEAEAAIEAVMELHCKGTHLSDQVILYRTNAQSRLFEEACMKAGLPYRIIGGVKFYARREVKDVLAYLHVILNPGDTLSLLRILNIPPRKIGETTLQHLQAHAAKERLSLWDTLKNAPGIIALNAGTKERTGRFVDIIERLREQSSSLTASELALTLLSEIELERWLRDDTEEGESRWQNVQELLSVMHKYDTLPPQMSLTSFLEEVALISEVDGLAEAREDALTLMTLHLCKGLEFEHVIIGGCEEGIFPHSSSFFDREQLEEERRLMYVGMTRAKTVLRVLFARSRMLWGNVQSNARSRFLDDLPSDVTEWRSDDLLSAVAWNLEKGTPERAAPQPSGDLTIAFNQDVTPPEERTQEEFPVSSRILHPVFGTGTVSAHRGDIVDIHFDSGERRSFALGIAPLRAL